MRPCEIADTLANGNIADARSHISGRNAPASRPGICLIALEVVEELVDSHGWTWERAIEKVRACLRGAKFEEYNEAAEAAYEMEV